MIAMQTIYLTVGSTIAIYLGALAVSSAFERNPRATLVSSVLTAAFVSAWFGAFYIFPTAERLMLPATLLVVLFAVLFFSPLGTTGAIKIGVISERFDERDTGFAREEYQPGSERYRQYYTHRPQYKDIDDRIRSLPPLLHPGGRFYDSVRSPQITDTFARIKEMTTSVDGPLSSHQVTVDPPAMTAQIKAMTLALGADEVGIGPLNPMFVYSHVGRGPEPWGQPIENNHRYAICFTVEMDHRHVDRAPTLPTVEETARKYLQAAEISIKLAGHIRQLGYPARAHISDSNYQIILPAVAHDAGLGELGRTGYLISPRFGARIRLGGVTTDLPLLTDRPVTFGVREFCQKCRKCATNCPAAAIPKGEPENVRGVEKWPMNVEQCLRYWRLIGTDCGLCMRVCPFSHPSTTVHNIVKAGVRRSSLARTVSRWGDDLIYGKKVRWNDP